MKEAIAFIKIKQEKKESIINHKILKNQQEISVINYARDKGFKIEKIESELSITKISTLNNEDTIFIESLESLANSTYKRLEVVSIMLSKKLTIYFQKQDFYIKCNNKVFIKMLEELFKIENELIIKNTEAAKNTRVANNTKVGRKKGKFFGSRFDIHKKDIKKLHNLGLSNTKILKKIEVKASPQALQSYIKTRELKIRESKDKNKKEDYQTPYPKASPRYGTRIDKKDVT